MAGEYLRAGSARNSVLLTVTEDLIFSFEPAVRDGGR